MSAAAIIFLGSIGLIVYVLAGYPLLLAAYAHLFPRPIHKQTAQPQAPLRVSIIVPVRNGIRWVEAKLRSLLASDYPPHLIDILIVSDGSTDGTNLCVERFPDPRVHLLELPPGGKAVAVNRGLEAASGDIIVLTDVRQQFDPAALTKLAACFADPTVGVVTGELIIREGRTVEEYNTGLYWRYEKWIRRNLNRVNAMLGATGSIYAIRRELATPIPPGILLDDVYLPFHIVFRGFRLYLEDAAKAYDLPTSLYPEFWRKVRTQAGVYQILFRFPALLWPGNRRFLYFVSHKLGRLSLPFALIAAAVSSFGLPDPWRLIAIPGQIVCYGLALIDPKIPENNPLKRVTAATRAFVVLVAAAFCALAVFFLPANRLWKETQVGVAAPPNELTHTGR